jgi:hypothetical protein
MAFALVKSTEIHLPKFWRKKGRPILTIGWHDKITIPDVGRNFFLLSPKDELSFLLPILEKAEVVERPLRENFSRLALEWKTEIRFFRRVGEMSYADCEDVSRERNFPWEIFFLDHDEYSIRSLDGSVQSHGADFSKNKKIEVLEALDEFLIPDLQSLVVEFMCDAFMEDVEKFCDTNELSRDMLRKPGLPRIIYHLSKRFGFQDIKKVLGGIWTAAK